MDTQALVDQGWLTTQTRLALMVIMAIVILFAPASNEGRYDFITFISLQV
jgi:hypothetical protein